VQVFYHDDWPGSYRSVNISPALWDNPLISVDAVVHRGELLPESPVRLPDLDYPRTRTNCGICFASIYIRFSLGHAWHNGSDLLRAGTDEVIAHQVGLSMIDAPSPYCGECVEAALFGDGLQIPNGCHYIKRHNRSLPPDHGLSEHPSQ